MKVFPVTVRDPERGKEFETELREDDFLLLCNGRMQHVQTTHFLNGTVFITLVLDPEPGHIQASGS